MRLSALAPYFFLCTVELHIHQTLFSCMSFGTYCRVIEKLVLTQPVKKLPEIYLICMFLMTFTFTILPLAPTLR